MRHTLALILLSLAACSPVPSVPPPADNTELAAIAAEDQAVRMGKDDTASDDARRRRVMELLATGAVATPQDKFNAGLVLQHTGLMNRGTPTLSVVVVPDSGTEELTGIEGEFTIIVEGKQHSYEFAYRLPAGSTQ